MPYEINHLYSNSKYHDTEIKLKWYMDKYE
jgi:hypothetical protein